MKIAVCVKQVALLGDEIEFADAEADIDPDYLDWALNDWDAAAVEEALQLKEQAGEGELVVLSVGENQAEDALRRALAMGADRAVRIAPTGVDTRDPVSVASALAAALDAEQPDLIFTGAQSADHVHGATGAALAGLLDLPAVAVVKRLRYDHANRRAECDRELEGGTVAETEVDTPAVITIQTGINEPRYASLRAIKQAEAEPITVVEPQVGPAAATIVRMYVPERAHSAEMLGTDPAEVARRIFEIVQEQLR